MPITQPRMLSLLSEAKALREDGERLRADAAQAMKLYRSGDFTVEDLPAVLYSIASTPTPKCDQLVIELAHFAKAAADNDKRRSRNYHRRRAAGIPEGIYGPSPTSHLTMVPPQERPTFNPAPTNQPEGAWSLDAIAKAIAVAEPPQPPAPIKQPELVQGNTPPPDGNVIYSPGELLLDAPPPDLSKGIFKR